MNIGEFRFRCSHAPGRFSYVLVGCPAHGGAPCQPRSWPRSPPDPHPHLGPYKGKPPTHPPTHPLLLQERVFLSLLEIAWWVGGWVGWMIEPSGAQHRLACGATVHRSLRVACDDRSSTSFSLLLLQIGARRRRAAAHRHTGSAACCCSDAAAKRSLAARRRRRRSRRSHGDSGRRSARHRRGRSSS